jgi:exodeoxyribonuclease VII large subunit
LEETGARIYKVEELTREIQELLEERFSFIWLEGEVSNFSSPLSGHYYMVIKDERAQIRAVMFRPQTRYLRFVPENGMKVLARGKIGIYPARGEYQIVLDYLEPIGAGALAVAFEQLKKRLFEEGLFDESRKRPLPFLPRKVAVITSPTGAAVRDFLKVLQRRFANIEVVIIPVRVQGEGASSEMVHALDIANRLPGVDVIVLTRGGGSMEDLWAYNEEELARAVRRSRIPVVSAVGHEIDVTICDLAADLRAPTPSAAAEMLVREKEGLKERVLNIRLRLKRAVLSRLGSAKEKTAFFLRALKDPRKALEDNWLRLDDLYGRMILATRQRLEHERMRLGSDSRAMRSPMALITDARKRLSALKKDLVRAQGYLIQSNRVSLDSFFLRLLDLNPRAILNRGYSIAFSLPERKVLRSSSETAPGRSLELMLGSGRLLCRVLETFE